jgi:FlaA1/EpsC-like NDP-sugar epimerase
MKENYFSQLKSSFLLLPRWSKQAIAITTDIHLCALTVWLSYYLRFGEFVAPSINMLIAILIAIAIAIPIFLFSGLYRSIFRFSSSNALASIAQAVIIYGLIYGLILFIIIIENIPRTIGIIQPILFLLAVVVSRLLVTIWLGSEYKKMIGSTKLTRALIYGAGFSGQKLFESIKSIQEIKIVGFIDDDDRLQDALLNGLPIYSPKKLESLVKKLNVNKILLAMPNVSRKRRHEILDQIQNSHVSVQTLPSIADIVHGKLKISDLQELDINDLLGRDSVESFPSLMEKNGKGRVVMVTGAGGSIGSELCRQIFPLNPKKLILVDHSELALYEIHKELQERLANSEILIVPILASVQDEHQINKIISYWLPFVIYHSAAYKHVPLVESNIISGVKNNVLGTLYTAKAALAHGVSNYVLISTDKAVRPTNIMGASKRLSELIVQAIGTKFRNAETCFSLVRFGNVLDSSGSVVPKFRHQISHGNQITLTHHEITRYFMTIPEAAQLVIQAGAIANGGEIFLLDMGDPVKIIELARKVIELSGFAVKDEKNPNGDIEIIITGLRSGEKLHEELLIGNSCAQTIHPKIKLALDDFVSWDEFYPQIQSLESALRAGDTKEILFIINKFVSGYIPSDEILDSV